LQITNPVSTVAGNATELRFAPSSAHSTRYASIQGINVDGNNHIDLAFVTALGGTITEKMRIDSSGNVGIGTTAPLSPLSVFGASNWGIARLISSGTNSESSISFRSNNISDGSTGHWLFGVNLSGAPTNTFTIYGAGGPGGNVFNISPAGSVGIGTTSPSAALDLQGTFAQQLIVGSSSGSNAGSILL